MIVQVLFRWPDWIPTPIGCPASGCSSRPRILATAGNAGAWSGAELAWRADRDRRRMGIGPHHARRNGRSVLADHSHHADAGPSYARPGFRSVRWERWLLTSGLELVRPAWETQSRQCGVSQNTFIEKDESIA